MLLLLRSIVFSLLWPAVLAGWIPLGLLERNPQWIDEGTSVHEIGAILLGTVALAAYFHCVWHFWQKGRGSVAPFDPPKKLVQRGLYRWVRNPMYLATGTLVVSEVVYFESWRIALYLVCLASASQLLVLVHEEPELGFRFGAMYEDYKRAVPRWWPRRPRPNPLYTNLDGAEH